MGIHIITYITYPHKKHAHTQNSGLKRRTIFQSNGLILVFRWYSSIFTTCSPTGWQAPYQWQPQYTLTHTSVEYSLVRKDEMFLWAAYSDTKFRTVKDKSKNIGAVIVALLDIKILCVHNLWNNLFTLFKIGLVHHWYLILLLLLQFYRNNHINKLSIIFSKIQAAFPIINYSIKHTIIVE